MTGDALPAGPIAVLSGGRSAERDISLLSGQTVTAGIDGVGLPGKMAEINQILDALPAAVRGELLKEYVNRLFVP